MSDPVTVKVSSRHQIVVPSAVREQLNIQSGDRLLQIHGVIHPHCEAGGGERTDSEKLQDAGE